MLWHAVIPLTSFVALLLTAPHGKDLSNLWLSNPNPQKPLRGQPLKSSFIRRNYVRYITSTPRYYVVLNCLYYNIYQISLVFNCGKAGFRPQSSYLNDLLSRQSRLLDSCSFLLCIGIKSKRVPDGNRTCVSKCHKLAPQPLGHRHHIIWLEKDKTQRGYGIVQRLVKPSSKPTLSFLF